MVVGDLLRELDERGACLRCGRSEDWLQYGPPGALPSALVAELKARREEVIRILREDDELERTGIIQVERQVFDLAREHFDNEGSGGSL
jgi:hypothetical protein